MRQNITDDDKNGKQSNYLQMLVLSDFKKITYVTFMNHD